MSEATKSGARHSAKDLRLVQSIHDAALELGAAPRENTVLPVSDVTDQKALPDPESMITFGSAVKSLDDTGRIGGYLVVLGTAETPDLTGDYFTAETDFGPHDTTPVYYQHGMDPVLGKKALDPLGKLRKDDVGVWIEAQLSLRDKYQAALFGMAKSGALGWSSGTAPHLTLARKSGNASHILAWPLGLDASLTPTPAEPRTLAVSLKSLPPALSAEDLLKATGDVAMGASPDNGGSQPNAIKKEITTVAENTLTLEGVAAQVSSLAASVETFLKALKPPTPGPGVVVEGGLGAVQVVDTEKPFKSFGGFLRAVADVGQQTADQETRNRLSANQKMAVKATGLNESVGSEGGFLVVPEVSTELLRRTYDTGAILSRVSRFPIGPNSNGMTWLGVDENSRVSGSRYGGVSSAWLSEGGTLTGTKPSFKRFSMNLGKVGCLVYTTDELLADATALEAYIDEVVPQELAFRLEDAIFRGSGVGQPLGIMNATGALVTVAAEGGQAVDTINVTNVLKMRARMWAKSRANAIWLVNQDAEPQFPAMTVGNNTVYVTNLNAAPNGALLGLPIVPNEYSATIGDLGDILLVDLSQYRLIDKGGVQKAASMHVSFTTDEMVYRFVYRVDGRPIWTTALTPAQGSNTLSPYVTLAAR